MSDDPFTHHPALRALITDPETSFFRNFKPSDLDARMKELGLADGWRRGEDEIEAERQAFLHDRFGHDLWIFAYGSLMWDPGFKFAEVRRGHVSGYSRRFILRDTFGARGSPDTPGLMAALDQGPGCDGLVFRIAQEAIEAESGVFWRRELLAFSYKPQFSTVSTGLGEVEALMVIANRESEYIRPDMTRSEQIRCIATGRGFLGTSLQYIENIAAHFESLGVQDDEVTDLLSGAQAFLADEEVRT